jgi:hypothetical protein
MTLLITVNKTHICNVTFINVTGKVVISKVFISIAVQIVKMLNDAFLNHLQLNNPLPHVIFSPQL